MRGRPNILVLVMDSVRAQNVSCYGYGRRTTPRLDALAEQATLFELAVSVGCWTLPVHGSLFTGLFPLNHGLNTSRDALGDDSPTLARRLSALGYESACFSNNPYISDATGLTQGFDLVEDLWRSSRPRGIARSRGKAQLRWLAERGAWARPLARAARVAARGRSTMRGWREWRSEADNGARLTNARLREWLSSRSEPARPFFAFVNYMETHERYRPPYPYNESFLPGRAGRWRAARLPTNKAAILGAPRQRRARALETITALYDGTLAYLDDQIGRLIDSLEALGVLDDTVVVVTSDHGDSLGEHDHLGHRLYLYEQLVHVPLIVRYPERFAAGARIGRQVQLGDLFPTLLELAGEITESHGADSFRSLLPAGSDETPRPYTVAENTGTKALGGILMRMIRGERYKLIWKSTAEHELYDLARDPGETENLAASRGDLVEELSAELGRWERELEGMQAETRDADYDEETLHRLRGLGYVG